MCTAVERATLSIYSCDASWDHRLANGTHTLVELPAALKIWSTTWFSAGRPLTWFCASYVCIRSCDALRVFSGIILYAAVLPDFVYILRGVQAGGAVCHLPHFSNVVYVLPGV